MIGKINIIGLGPGGIEDISLGTMEKMKHFQHVYLRTRKHPTVSYLEKIGIVFKSFDSIYDQGENFQEVYHKIVLELIEKAKQEKEIVYAVPGHPLVAEETVERILKLSEQQKLEVEILPAMSFIDAMIQSLKIDPIYGLKIIDALEMDSQGVDPKIGNIITQVYSPLIASETKLKLMEYYKDETMIIIVRAAGVEGEEKIVQIPLYELDRQPWIDYLTSVYIPPVVEVQQMSGGQIQRLEEIVSILRGKNGCPWDKKQTHESLKENFIEEVYEVIDAICKEDMKNLEEELGDVLLQVVFHSQIAKEKGYFDLQDVIRGICEKLIYRHPHIFGNVDVKTSKEVLINWEKLKKIEKDMNTQTEVLKAVPNSLPALMRAYKVQKKAADIGFDWESIEDVIEKIKEEFYEFLEVYSTSNPDKIVEELGDLLFSVVNGARFLKIQPEIALGKATEKFIHRFSYMEDEAKKQNKNLEEMSLEQMNQLWNQAKKSKI